MPEMIAEEELGLEACEVEAPLPAAADKPILPARFYEGQKLYLQGVPMIVDRITRRGVQLIPAKQVNYTSANGVMEVWESLG